MGFQLLNPNCPGCGCTSNPSRLTCTECGSEKKPVTCAKCGHDEVYSWTKTEPSVLKVDAICDKCKSFHKTIFLDKPEKDRDNTIEEAAYESVKSRKR